MEVVQIQVSSGLAKRLRPYQNKLAYILERGLRYIETEADTVRDGESQADEKSMQERISTVLQQVGVTNPALESAAEYVASSENRNWQPIRAGGKPASELIMEERGSYL
ncbi:MAG TPA: hypothetical protein G4N96_01790 [Chloroflexi bacterium]|nr:hypothetical protein [Chloroflexota bacterium]